ncbi:MAG: hypothetical protein WDW36_001606 [Sanguina aurantia]
MQAVVQAETHIDLTPHCAAPSSQAAQSEGNEVTALVLGGGSYGTAVVDPHHPDTAIKYFKQSVTPKEALYEFDAHSRISTVFAEFMAEHSTCKVHIPAPRGFSSAGGILTDCHAFSCSYSMDWIRSARADRVQQHLLLDRGHQSSAGCIVFASCGVDSVGVGWPGAGVLTEAEMARGRPRGEYHGIAQVVGKFGGQTAVEDIAHRMGILYGVVAAAGYAPKEVEVVLDGAGNVCLYDFGMVFVGGIEDSDAGADMYTPKQPDVNDHGGDTGATAAAVALFERYREGLAFAEAFYARRRASAQQLDDTFRDSLQHSGMWSG